MTYKQVILHVQSHRHYYIRDIWPACSISNDDNNVSFHFQELTCQMSKQISLTILLKCGENKAIKYCYQRSSKSGTEAELELQ